MSSAVYILRAFLANLIALPPSRLYRNFFDRDTDRNHELQVGDCRFWGPEEFTSSCRSAMTELKSADKQMFARLTSSGSITFWLKSAMLKNRVYNKKARFYSIEPCLLRLGSSRHCRVHRWHSLRRDIHATLPRNSRRDATLTHRLSAGDHRMA